MTMDKKDKILILIAPFALGAVGYMFFGSKFKGETPTHAESDFTSIEAPVTETRKKRTEIYRDKYEQENAEKFKRRIENDEMFFSDEVKPDTADAPTAPQPASELASEEPPQTPLTAETDKKGSKPKVIIRYIERPALRKDSIPVTTQPATKTVRRAGFVSQSSSSSTTEQSNQDVTADITIPVVVQEAVDVKSGSNIQLRTLEEVKLNGVVVPKNSLVTGIVSVTQERINVKVNSVKGINRTVQIKLDAYDLDGNEGMPVEGGVNKEIKKDVVASAIQESGRVVNIPILNRIPTASSGNKKITDPVIPVPKGYKLFLKPQVK